MSEQGVEQPSGEPVLRMMVEDMVLLILTDWGLFVRKSKIQLQSDGAFPRVDSLITSVRYDGAEGRGEI